MAHPADMAPDLEQSMSAIVDFPLDRTRLPGFAVDGASAAEIVIFPGVRIERRDFAPPARPESRPRPRRASHPVVIAED